DLSRYRVVLAPNLYLLRPGVAENLERFVSAGGILVMSFFSGMVDQDEQILLGGYPATLRRLLGLSMQEFNPFVPGQTNSLISGNETFACDLWTDLIDLEGAEAMASFGGDFYAGRPAVTRHHFGGGSAYYLGTRPEPAYMARLLERVCDEGGVAPVLDAPTGVEAVRRCGAGGSYLFLLNHTLGPVNVTLPRPGDDLLAACRIGGTVRLEPFGVLVVREDTGAAH
ncbi:MAG TPA: beta-galactosidase trimerization domain-containing protein, partial [Chloroflexota bacterium]|nr:beta-galactosidase trimerization domain-containing protein [Chloroflexota bacterium]